MTKGLVNVSVMYPNSADCTFDMDYYLDKHMPMVNDLMGEAMKHSSVQKGFAGGEPGSDAPYIAIANMYFESVNDFQKAFGPHAKQILGDIKNYTNAQPIIQMSEMA